MVEEDKQNFSVTTWRGEIHLRSARLKQEVVDTRPTFLSLSLPEPRSF